MKRKIPETTRVTRQSPVKLRLAVTATAIPFPPVRSSKKKKLERTCRVKRNSMARNSPDSGLFRYSVEERLFDPKFDEITGKSFVSDVDPDDLTLDRLLHEGLSGPLMFRDNHPVGMRVPSNLTVEVVVEAVGEYTRVEVLDSTTQEGTEMTMGEFGRYFLADYTTKNPAKIYNLIDLEVSHTSLSDLIDPPLLVRQIDWATNIWPAKLRPQKTSMSQADKVAKYPKTQKYVLLSKAGCYTDFHVDFGGSSVWYRIIRGRKLFLLIPPSAKNLQIYAQWVLSGQYSRFLGDLVDQCERILLTEGQTLIISSGWIHAVYTLEDSIVIGGNFLHSFSSTMQVDISILEDSLKVAKKIRYPFFHDLLWLVVQHYAAVWTNCSYNTSSHEVSSLRYVFEFLKSISHTATVPCAPVARKYVPNQAGLLKKFEKILAGISSLKPLSCRPVMFSMNMVPSLTSPTNFRSEDGEISVQSSIKVTGKAIAIQTDDVSCCCVCHQKIQS